jgi:hypothetical protein
MVLLLSLCWEDSEFRWHLVLNQTKKGCLHPKTRYRENPHTTPLSGLTSPHLQYRTTCCTSYSEVKQGPQQGRLGLHQLVSLRTSRDAGVRNWALNYLMTFFQVYRLCGFENRITVDGTFKGIWKERNAPSCYELPRLISVLQAHGRFQWPCGL